jgi:hypothetical protein
MKAGVALNPHTPIDVLKDIIFDIDVVCIMSVNPGFGGQKFIEHTYEKVTALKQLIVQHNASTLIEIEVDYCSQEYLDRKYPNETNMTCKSKNESNEIITDMEITISFIRILFHR